MTTLRLFIGVLVTLVWAVAWVAAILTADYTGVGAITPVMLLVVGGIFGQDAIKMLRNGNGKRRGR